MLLVILLNREMLIEVIHLYEIRDLKQKCQEEISVFYDTYSIHLYTDLIPSFGVSSQWNKKRMIR